MSKKRSTLDMPEQQAQPEAQPEQQAQPAVEEFGIKKSEPEAEKVSPAEPVKSENTYTVLVYSAHALAVPATPESVKACWAEADCTAEAFADSLVKKLECGRTTTYQGTDLYIMCLMNILPAGYVRFDLVR